MTSAPANNDRNFRVSEQYQSMSDLTDPVLPLYIGLVWYKQEGNAQPKPGLQEVCYEVETAL